MDKRILTIPTSLLLTGAVWPVITMAEDAAIDRNQDGYISAAEAQVDAKLAETFTELDVNGDGLLDKTELTPTEPQAEDEPEDDN